MLLFFRAFLPLPFSTLVANSILNLTVGIGDRMDFSEDSLNVTVPSLALSILNVDAEGFDGLTFGVSSVSTSLVPEVR